MEEYDRKYVKFEDVVCLKETEKAVLVSCDEFPQDIWIPVSQISDDSDVFAEGHEGDLIITRWIAEQKDLL